MKVPGGGGAPSKEVISFLLSYTQAVFSLKKRPIEETSKQKTSKTRIKKPRKLKASITKPL